MPRPGAAAVRPAHRRGPAPEPRRTRGAPDRSAAGAAADEPRRTARPRGPQRRGAAARRAAVDADRLRRRDDPGGRDRAAGGRRPARGGDRRDACADLDGRVLPDQHGDGRAAVRACDRVRESARRRADLRPVLRDRHGRAAVRTPGGGGVGARDRRGSGRRRDLECRSERDRQCPLLRRRRPACNARAGRAGRTARSNGRRPATRRPLSEDRAGGSSRPGPSGSCMCPATRPRSRRTPRSWSKPATGCSGSGPSTCSRRRRTSSAWRCSSVDRVQGVRCAPSRFATSSW